MNRVQVVLDVKVTRQPTLQDVKDAYMLMILKKNKGNFTAAAAELGVTPKVIRKRIPANEVRHAKPS